MREISMLDEETYGQQFLRHLKAISNRTSFNYDAIQLIKTMSQNELACYLGTRARLYSEIVRQNVPKDAAFLIHLRNVEAGQMWM